MKRPRIVVTLTGTESAPAEQERQRYLDAVTAAGGDAIGIRVGAPVPSFDGLFLTGGKDISAEHGGARDPAHPKTVDPRRDALENVLLAQALRGDCAVLAVCRGFQLLNVYLGGTLRAHVEGHDDGRGPVQEHKLKPLAGSRLAKTEPGTFRVNSRHHQALDRVATPLVVTAKVGELVEAVEHRRNRWVVGVQWHPERTNLDRNLDLQPARALLAEFVRQALTE